MKEYLISHGWLLMVLAVAGILLAGAAIFTLFGYDQNTCRGFGYFHFVDQRADSSSYSMQLINDRQPIIITSVVAGSSPADFAPAVSKDNIQPGEPFSIRTSALGIEAGRPFSSTRIVVNYDIINGPANLTDTVTCAGRVV